MFLKSVDNNDPRLKLPQCVLLKPVETLHQNPWFSVKNRGGYFTTEFNQLQIIILPVVNNESILMVRVIRPVIADNTLELPAGAVESGESPAEAASRELMEEAGIEIKDLKRFKLLIPISNSPNRDPLLIHIFQVDLTLGEYAARRKHDNEILDVKCVKFEDVKKMIISGEIYISVPMAIIGRYLLNQDL